jgi:hypothetical protein
MKVFIRKTKPVVHQDHPNGRPTRARLDLGQVARAVERIFEAQLEDVEILLSYDEPRYDLVLPVPPSPSRRDPLRQRPPSEESRQGDRDRPAIPRKKEPPL